MFVSRRMINIGLAAVVVGGGVGTYVALQSSPAAPASTQTVTASKGAVLSSVTATGSASSSKQITLNFQSSGVLSAVDVKIGDHVHAGQELGAIQNASQQDAVNSAEQSLASAETKLAKAEGGATPTTLLEDEISTESAQQTTNTAIAGLARDQATAKMDVKEQTASVTQAKQAVTNAKANAAIDATDDAAAVTQAKESVTNAKTNATIALTQAQESVTQAKQNLTDAEVKLSEDETALSQAKTAERTCAITSLPAGCTPSADQATVTKDEQAVTNDDEAVQADTTSYSNAEYAVTAQKQKNTQSIQSAENALTNAENSEAATAQKDAQSIQSAQDSLTNAENSQTSSALKDSQTIQQDQEQINADQLNQESTTASNAAKEKSTATAIASDQASVDSAEQSLASAQQSLDETVLTAPVTGTVASVNGLVGETPGSGSSSTSSSSGSSSSSGFVTLTDLSTLQVVADFAESTVAKIDLGQAATLTFSALLDEKFSGTVSSIAVNGSTVSNVVEYAVTISIIDPPTTLKPGMTATVSVTTAKVDNVVELPSTAISTKGSTATVQVVAKNGKRESRTITIGLRGNTSDEITSGLAPGDKVVVTHSSSTSSSSGSPFTKGGGFPGGGGVVRIGGA